MRVRCIKNGAITRLFTDGKVYDCHQERGQERTRVWTIMDDKGHPRVIIPGELSAHLKSGRTGPYNQEYVVGRFVPVAEGEE